MYQNQENMMSNNVIYRTEAIQQQLRLKDPFIVTMHHVDYYPTGNEKMGPTIPPTPDAHYSMYHGETVPGFPAHPHTGFETITLVEQGTVDHFDSLGNSGRYADGDVQWQSTGNGVEHSEMFPLVHQDKVNPLELFQIWFNSSPAQKKEQAVYKMLWREDIPHVKHTDDQGNHTDVRVISGQFNDQHSLTPPPYSWANAQENKVNIFMITLDANAEIVIPATSSSSTRFAYFYEGDTLDLAGQTNSVKRLLELKPDAEIILKNGATVGKVLWLEGEPIGAPVAAHGPFVLNSEQELKVAFARYFDTQFGGWPWPTPAPVFSADQKRIASYNNGEQIEYPDQRV